MLFPESWCSDIGHCGAGQLGPNQDKDKTVQKLDRSCLVPGGRGAGNGAEHEVQSQEVPKKH